MISHDSFQAIADLDLEPIKVKLMHEESGEGWSLEQVNAVEFEYRRFLYLMKTFPHEQTAPLMDVDIFWHYHILDTMKYAADCEAVFGYFLHHFPYIGLRGEDDEQVHHRVGERMRELYEATFGESYDRSARPAYSGAAVQAGGAETAYSGAATRQAGETAYSGAQTVAYSGAATQQAKQTAYSGAQAVAYSGAATKQARETAYSGAQTVAYSGAATRQAQQTAYSGAQTAYSGAATRQAKETAYSGAQTVAHSGAAISDANANKMAYSGLQAEQQTAYSGAAVAAQPDSMYTVRPRLSA
ncbi:glycine-rich domain-containing protein-like [Duganella sp. LX20W]|uniref:Glycine-rich domain-containing protein-like n=1 Tax=Rugamonas brunnea TaxID=2758569 RepID=A0A7W2EQX4_9BURK|nr:glycine-rich domain-containing protein-like [Rugamonas brunnea]MBA5636951.1 glycine-rich domain-containing protein-like [Rugamonas brunnea]